MSPIALESGSDANLPVPPSNLSYDGVALRFMDVMPGDAVKGFAPYYHFRILLDGERDVGHINLRIGDTEHVQRFAGHIGFVVNPEARGQKIAGRACRALAPFIRTIYDSVIITCDPDNIASRKTIESLGASFLDESDAAAFHPDAEIASHIKRRYRWTA